MDPWLLAGALCALVFGSEWLTRHTPLRHLGTALVVIVASAVAANSGLIPTYSEEIEVYAAVFAHLAPLGIFWLLLEVRLAHVVRAGAPMIGLFLAGCAGTFLGVLTGMHLVGGPRAFGELFHALGGMFVGTYTGGSVNYNAIALHYGVQHQPALYAGAAAVDSLMTTLWMAVTLTAPRLWRGSRAARVSPPVTAVAPDPDRAWVSPAELALLLALGLAALPVSRWGAEALEQLGAHFDLALRVPSILVLTSLALVLAQWRRMADLRGAHLLGMLAVYLFLAVIGALCDVGALRRIGALGGRLLLFVSIVLALHGIVILCATRVFRQDPEVAAVASQAGVGGGATALALARSLGRADLVLPAILVGSLGTALGSYLGLMAAAWLGASRAGSG